MKTIATIFAVVVTAIVFIIVGLFLSGRTSVVSAGGAAARVNIDGLGSVDFSQW